MGVCNLKASSPAIAGSNRPRSLRAGRATYVQNPPIVKALIAALLVAACSTPTADTPDATIAPPDGAVDADTTRRELRGVWITRFAFATQADLEAIIDRAAAANFNAVFVQIRAEGDAYYDSALEPWARRLTGMLGRKPSWDPLRVALDRAHSHGMELHAYFNVFSAYTATVDEIPVAEGPVQHALVDHPDWLAVDSTGENRDSEYRWFSPGNPAVRAHITAVARDLLSKYEVDGLHLDRIRTPGPDYSRDAVSTAAYDAARATDPSLTWADFMRSQVNAMVADLYAAVLDVRPSAKLSASVWGIYKPLPGCSTSQGYANYYQDSLAWLDAGIIDAIVPMIYWSIEPGACTDWSTLLDGFLAQRGDRHVWAGMHALDQSMWDFDQVRARIDRSRVAGAQGTVVFASTYLDQDPTRWDAFVGTEASPGPYAEPAVPPVTTWR